MSTVKLGEWWPSFGLNLLGALPALEQHGPAGVAEGMKAGARRACLLGRRPQDTTAQVLDYDWRPLERWEDEVLFPRPLARPTPLS